MPHGGRKSMKCMYKIHVHLCSVTLEKLLYDLWLHKTHLGRNGLHRFFIDIF